MDKEPIRTAKQRRKRGRPKKSPRQHNETICFRIEVGLPQADPLRHPHTCDCGISSTKTQTALLSLRDRREEEELMAIESGHLTILEPARGIEVKVTDSYETINDSVPLGHPAKCIGTSPRRGDAKVHSWQIAVFLSQVRNFAMSTLPLPIFSATIRPREPTTMSHKVISTSRVQDRPKGRSKLRSPMSCTYMTPTRSANAIRTSRGSSSNGNSRQEPGCPRRGV